MDLLISNFEGGYNLDVDKQDIQSQARPMMSQLLLLDLVPYLIASASKDASKFGLPDETQLGDP